MRWGSRGQSCPRETASGAICGPDSSAPQPSQNAQGPLPLPPYPTPLAWSRCVLTSRWPLQPRRWRVDMPPAVPAVPCPQAVAPSRAPGAAARASEGRGAQGAEAREGAGAPAPRAMLGEKSVEWKISVSSTPGSAVDSAKQANGIYP